MDHLIGLTGNGYALVAADRKVAHSIIAVKHDEDKILQLDSHKLLACAGELGDTKNFSEFVQKNMALYQLRNGIKLSTHAAAHYTRSEIAHAIRSAPKMCNMIMVGHDEDAGPSLYHMDYIGGMHKMNFAAHGYGGYFALSLLDRWADEEPRAPPPPLELGSLAGKHLPLPPRPHKRPGSSTNGRRTMGHARRWLFRIPQQIGQKRGLTLLKSAMRGMGISRHMFVPPTTEARKKLLAFGLCPPFPMSCLAKITSFVSFQVACKST